MPGPKLHATSLLCDIPEKANGDEDEIGGCPGEGVDGIDYEGIMIRSLGGDRTAQHFCDDGDSKF